jgi:hypothetical protein
MLRSLHTGRKKRVKRFPFIITTVLFLLACSSAPLFAADEPAGNPEDKPGTQASQYSLGDQVLTINAGLFLPLFLLPTGTPLLNDNGVSHLSAGITGSLSWATYVTPEIRLGAELGGSYSVSPNSNSLLMLPFVAKASYIFTLYPIEIPVSFAVGMNVIKYTDLYTIDLLLRPGVSGYWIYNSTWSFGLNLNYWFDMQFDTTNPSNNRVGNFLEISLSALYHY